MHLGEVNKWSVVIRKVAVNCDFPSWDWANGCITHWKRFLKKDRQAFLTPDDEVSIIT